MEQREDDSHHSDTSKAFIDDLNLDEEGLQRLAAMLDSEDGQEKFSRAFRGAIEESADHLVGELKRTSRASLTDARSFRRGFESRLRRRWKKALDLFEMVLIATPEAGSMVDEQYCTRAVAENDLTFHALKLLHGRACVTASEVRALLTSGHPTGAHARWRTLHELAVVACIVKEHGNDVAERYLLHQHVEAWKDLKVYQEHCATLQDEPFSQQECDEIEDSYTALIGRYGRSYGTTWGWAIGLPLSNPSNPGIADLEKLAGLSHLRPYYGMGNKGVHATSRSVALNVVNHGPGQVMLAESTNAGLSDAGQGALISLNQVTTCLLIHAFDKLNDPTLLISCRALDQIVQEANKQFARIELELRAEEEQFWAGQQTSQEISGE